jgi:hypothetical protein
MEQDVDALRAEVAALRAEVAELHRRPSGARTAEGAPRPMSRRGLLAGLAGAGAAGVASLATAPPAAAADGDPLTLGVDNTSSSLTDLHHTAGGETDLVGLRITSDVIALFVQSTKSPESPEGQAAVRASTSADGFADFAVHAEGHDGFALYANNDSAFPTVVAANRGSGPALAGLSDTGGPQLYLEPGQGHPNGPPPAAQGAGAIRVDGAGDVWLCVAGGPDPTWTRLLREDTAAGRVVPIAPFRVLDTRAPGGRPAGAPAVPGQTQGPLGSLQTVTLDLAGIAPIPSSANGVVGNLTVVAPSHGGFLVARPSGATTLTSSVIFAKDATIANAFTSALGPDGLSLVALGPASYHLVVDITAYIT